LTDQRSMSQERTYGLLESDLESILDILRSNMKIDQVILFGSRAKGDNSNGSDIDLAIRGKDLKLDDILESKTRFEELPIPYKIDLIIYDRINEQELKDHVDRVGKVLFKRM